MNTPRKKTSTPPRKASAQSARRLSQPRPPKRSRFWSVFGSTAVGAFVLFSALLHPQGRELVLQDLRSEFAQLHWVEKLDLLRWELLDALGEAPRVVQGNQATQFTQCPQFFPQARVPAWTRSQPGLRELCFSAFAVLHNGKTKTPVFVVERLNRSSIRQAQQQTREDRFFADARLPRAERAELEDYRGSGYSRGHMAPAANMPSPEAMAQSFSLANMVPQDQTHNAGAWSQIEQATRRYALRATGDVYVFTGPVYASSRPRTVGPGRVAVPTHLFKLVHDASNGRSWVHWQANAAGEQVDRPITYEEFVRRTGLRLLDTGSRP